MHLKTPLRRQDKYKKNNIQSLLKVFIQLFSFIYFDFLLVNLFCHMLLPLKYNTLDSEELKTDTD